VYEDVNLYQSFKGHTDNHSFLSNFS